MWNNCSLHFRKYSNHSSHPKNVLINIAYFTREQHPIPNSNLENHRARWRNQVPLELNFDLWRDIELLLWEDYKKTYVCHYKYFQVQKIRIMQTIISNYKENKLEISNRKINFKLYSKINCMPTYSYKCLKNIGYNL